MVTDTVCDRDHEGPYIGLLHHCPVLPKDSKPNFRQRMITSLNMMKFIFVGAKGPSRDGNVCVDGPTVDFIPPSPSESHFTVPPPTHDDDEPVATSVAHDSVTMDHGQVTQTHELVLDIQNSARNHIDVETLSRIVKEKNLESLKKLGGVDEIITALGTNKETGILGEAEVRDNRLEYGSNIFGEILAPPERSMIFHFVIKASREWQIILLFGDAILSLVLTGAKYGLRNGGWYEEAVLFLTIFLLVASSSYRSYNDYCRELLVQELFNQNILLIDVLRHGSTEKIAVSDIVVGDIVRLKAEDWIPADGLFINGSEDFKLDEEFDGLHDSSRSDPSVEHQNNPIFLCCGTKVMEGSAKMLVTSVRKNTEWGEMMCKVKHDPCKHEKKLPVRLSKLNNLVQIIGYSASIIVLVVLLLRFFLGKEDNDKEDVNVGELMKVLERLIAKPKAIGMTSIFAVLMLGALEGLPLVINCSLKYRNKKLHNEHKVIMREPCGCITLCSVTTICIDKTDNLGPIFDDMEIDKFWVGDQFEVISSKNIATILSANIREAICDGVDAAVHGYDLSIGRPIESDPLLLKVLPWVEKNLDMDMAALKQNREELISRSLDKERSAMLLQKKNGNAKNTYLHLHCRGSAETILALCSQHYNKDGNIEAMNQEKRAVFQKLIEGMTTDGLQSIALVYKLIEDKDGVNDIKKDYASKLYENGLSLLGIVGLKYPCCVEEKRSAVDAFRNAGVSIKLVTSESNMAIVRATAIGYGILRSPSLDSDTIVLSGEEFRNFTEEERKEKAAFIAVMGNASPSDKLHFVQCLKSIGQVVAVTGTKLSDSPVLKEADVGVGLMEGTKISEMAKECSDIVISHGKLDSIVMASLVGRCSYQNCQKFIQFELTINFSWLLITFATMAILGETPIPILEFFLVHVIVSTLAALSLLSEPPATKVLSETRPVNQTGSLITKAMWRNILLQISYQVLVLLIFQFTGQTILPSGVKNLNKLEEAMIFNGFVLCQILNQLNAREPEKKNVFKGILRNYWFLLSVGVPIILQVVVMLFATRVTGYPGLSLVQWLVCVLFAVTSSLVDCVGKCISDGSLTNTISSTTMSQWLKFTSLLPSSTSPWASQSSWHQLPVTVRDESANAKSSVQSTAVRAQS